MFARRLAPLLGCVAGPALAIVALTYAGHGALAGPPLQPGEWRAWVAGRDPLDTSMAIARTAILGGAWYVLVATVAALAARLLAVPRLVRTVDLLALPAVRRAVHGAIGVGLATTSLTLSPALAHAGTRTPPVMVVDETPSTVTSPESSTPAPPTTWTVRPGDHLWHIAATVVEGRLHRPPTDDEVVPYWRELIAANRARLVAPDNPDLVFPGQVFTLPEP